MFSIKFNKAQISHRHATDAPPTHHRRMLYVISSKSGRRVGRLSVDCRSTVDRLSVDCRPTVGRQSTDALADVLADASVGSDSLPLPTMSILAILHFTSKLLLLFCSIQLFLSN